jgi:hypothetical protein
MKTQTVNLRTSPDENNILKQAAEKLSQQTGEKENISKTIIEAVKQFNESEVPIAIKEVNVIPPTFEMVEKYCNERRNDINPAKFIAYYEQKGWKIGKEKMKNWKMAIHTWEHKNYNTNILPAENKKLQDYSDQELINELKRRGYSGLLEIKREISF